MTLERMARIRLLQPMIYKGIALEPGAEIEVDEARSVRLVEKGVAEKLEIFIIESPTPAPQAEPEPSPQEELPLEDPEEEDAEEVDEEESGDESEKE